MYQMQSISSSLKSWDVRYLLPRFSAYGELRPKRKPGSLGEGGSFHSPYELSGMDKAVKRIVQAAKNREKVVIYGDYDVDGVTATAILLELLPSARWTWATTYPTGWKKATA